MTYQKPEQKLISFAEKSPEYFKVAEEIKNGWQIINLIKNGNYYLAIMEKKTTSEDEAVYIPPRKKLKFIS
jgi:hypothetical protein